MDSGESTAVVTEKWVIYVDRNPFTDPEDPTQDLYSDDDDSKVCLFITARAVPSLYGVLCLTKSCPRRWCAIRVNRMFGDFHQ